MPNKQIGSLFWSFLGIYNIPKSIAKMDTGVEQKGVFKQELLFINLKSSITQYFDIITFKIVY